MNKKSKKVSNLQKLVSQNSNFEFLTNGKIKCKITNHQFLPTVENFTQHLNSKSYKKAVEAQFDISQFQQFLQTHRQNKNFLFCKLTGVKLPKKKTAITKHVQGKKFLKRLQQYKSMIQNKEGQQENQIQQDQEDQEVEQQQQVKVQKKKKVEKVEKHKKQEKVSKNKNNKKQSTQKDKNRK